MCVRLVWEVLDARHELFGDSAVRNRVLQVNNSNDVLLPVVQGLPATEFEFIS